MHINPGDKIYKYEFKQYIGKGGFGKVWLAHDGTISKDVAVKVLPRNTTRDTEISRLQEARIGNLPNHNNLVKILYADEILHNGTELVIIVMDYYENGTILSRVNARRFMPIPDVVRFMTDILQGLEYLHDLNLYHNDIKPKNILIGNDGQGMLTDYGIASYSLNKQPTQPIGIYDPHAAPEVLNFNQVSTQTDIYHVGLTTFRLLNGHDCIHEKFKTLDWNDYQQRVKDGKIIQPNDYLPFVPRDLKRIIKKATDVDPARRYKSAVDMRRALERLSYPGYWTTDSFGIFIGHNGGHEYRFEKQELKTELFKFTAYKKFQNSGKETIISKFSQKNLTRKEVEGLKQKFMQWVVTG